MSLQDISHIVSSRERLDLIEGHLAQHEDTSSATENGRYSIQGPDGKFYQPLTQKSTIAETTKQQEGHSDDNYEYGMCGIGACKPKWSQRLASLNVFVIAYGVAGIWMITLSSFLGSQVTSIERHLGMSSSKTGFILSSNEIGYLVVVILGSHLGKYTHIPVFLSVSGIIFGLGTVCMAFGRLEVPRVWQDVTAPDLQTAASDLQDNSKYLCNFGVPKSNNLVLDGTNSSTFPPDLSADVYTNRSTSWVFYLLVFCSMIGGAVKSYRIPLLTYYIESNIVNKDRSALLLGISVTAMVLGPPIALFLGGYTSSLPVDLKETTMSKYDQRWVGAWWLGFTIIGLACIICSVPIMFFPRHMRKLKDQKVTEPTDKASLRQMLIDLPKSLGRCFRRPIYVMALIFNCIEGFAFAGSFSFYQKYMETQFNKTAHQISTITGVLTLFSIVLGTFSGGFFTTKLKLGLRGCALVTLAMAGVTVLLDCLNLWFGCKNSDIVGITGNRTESIDTCDCSSDVFIVCGDNAVNYLSPCLAGCTNATQEMIFTNCTGISNGQARPGMCDLDCDFFIPYLVLFCAGYFLGTLSLIPGFMLSVRSVEQQDQSLAFGTSAFCQTLIGILPSPIFFGKLIDMACSLWSPGGNCMLYDRESFRYLYYGVSLGLRFASLAVMAVTVWLTHREARRESSKQPSKTPVEQ